MRKHGNDSKKKSKKILLSIIVLLVIAAVGFGAWRYFTGKNEIEADSKLYFSGLEDTKQIGKTQMDIEYNVNCSHAIEYPEVGKDEIDSQIKDIIKQLKEDFVNQYKDENIIAQAEQAIEGINYFQYIGYETYLAPDNKMSMVLFETQESGESNIISEKAYTYNFDLNTGKKLENTDIFKEGYKAKLSETVKSFLTQDADYKDSLMENYEDIISDKDENLNNYIITNDDLIVFFDKYDILPGNFGIAKATISYDSIKDIIAIDTSKKTQIPGANTGVQNEASGKYTDVNETVYAKTIVNIRASDNAQSEQKGTLEKGESVTRVGVGDNGWSKVTYNNETCYISSTYLSTEKPADANYAQTNETVYAISQVHVRENSNTTSKILGTLNVGDSVTRTATGDNGWSQVTYNNQTAYVYSSYLSTTKVETSSVNIPVDTTRNIDPSKPMVALTFDDGPNPVSTPKILETLQKYNAVATFFDLGTCMASYPKISQQEEAMGCEVGSHTYAHKNLNTLSAAQIEEDIGKAESIFQSTLGHKPNLIRPPYGNANSTVKATLKYPLINWDIDTEDWKSRNADSVLAEVRKYSNYDGRVILMHSIYTSTATAVETLVPELINKGYQLVTIPELAKYKGVTLETGKLYYDFR